MQFSPTDIAYFMETVRNGHVGRAALACGVTQSAVTKALQRLEENVGGPLFERGAHGARLTAHGQLFLEVAQRFHLLHADMVRSASEIRAQSAGLLRVGITNPGSDSASVQALAQLVRARPGLRLKLVPGKSDVLAQAVSRGELDMALLPSYSGSSFGCEQLVLGSDPLQIAARIGHPLAANARPSVSQTVEYDWIMPSRDSAARRLVAALYEQRGLPPPQVRVEVEFTSEAVLGMLVSTDLLTMAPVSVLRVWAGRVAALPIPELEIQRSLVLITRHQASWSPLMQSLRDSLLQRYQVAPHP